VNTSKYNKQLLDGEELLSQLFKPQPSKSWLRDQRRAKKIPFIRLGRKIFYDPDEVRKALAERYTIHTSK
jgi:hypothetical protein